MCHSPFIQADLECWRTSRRGFEHSVELTHWGQTLGKYEVVFQDFWFLSGIQPIQIHPPPALPLQNTILTTTFILSQHITTLPNPQNHYLDSLYSPLPNWNGHPQFHIYKNWCRFNQHASKLQHNTNIYKTINSGANMHPCLGSPEAEISISPPSWLLSASGCATRHGMRGCLFWLWTWHMRLCVLISRYISWIHL